MFTTPRPLSAWHQAEALVGRRGSGVRVPVRVHRCDDQVLDALCLSLRWSVGCKDVSAHDADPDGDVHLVFWGLRLAALAPGFCLGVERTAADVVEEHSTASSVAVDSGA